MSDLSEALAKVEGEHATALNWFREHRGKTVSWSTIQDHVHKGARLVTQAKGIYKPSYTDYAVSVRQTLDSPYADKEVIRRPDGSWVYPYFQENPYPAERDREFTNRGLVKCMDDAVPVGVLLQVKPKPGVEYDILGLALVTEWKDGYFILEGFSDQGEGKAAKLEPDAAHDRARAEATSPVVENFNPAEVADRRDRGIAEVFRRRGQAKFRAALLRADLHSLFDLGLLTIEPTTMTIALAAQLSSTSYADLAGRRVSLPVDPLRRPSAEALAQHLKWAGIVPS